MKIELPINGLTHHDLQGPGLREAYVAVAKGRQVVLIAQPCAFDLSCVAVYDEARYIGNVMSEYTTTAQQVLMASAEEMLCGTIVAVEKEGYRLRVDCGDCPVVSEEEVRQRLPRGLGEWTTSVARMMHCERLQRVVAMEKVLTSHLRNGGPAAVDATVRVADALSDLLRFDLSSEMRCSRKLFCKLLSDSGVQELVEAGERMMAACQRVGGDHQMADFGEWAKKELSRGILANRMLSETKGVARQKVVQEARALPGGLYELWQTDVTEFARVVYGMWLSRDELLRMLSCLIWLDRTAEEEVCTLTEEDVFVRRVVDETKLLFKHERNKADGIRQVMNKLGRSDAETELDAWIEGRETPAARAIEEQTGAIERVLRQQAEALRQMARQPRTETINGDKYVMESGSQQVQMALPLGTDAAEVAGRLTGGVHQ